MQIFVSNAFQTFFETIKPYFIEKNNDVDKRFCEIFENTLQKMYECGVSPHQIFDEPDQFEQHHWFYNLVVYNIDLFLGGVKKEEKSIETIGCVIKCDVGLWAIISEIGFKKHGLLWENSVSEFFKTIVFYQPPRVLRTRKRSEIERNKYFNGPVRKKNILYHDLFDLQLYSPRTYIPKISDKGSTDQLRIVTIANATRKCLTNLIEEI